MYDWAIGLLESMRRNSPATRVVLIPYNQRIERLRAVQPRYGFEIMSDPRLDELEAVARLFGEHRFIRNFRKLAASFGPCDVNVFLDADVIVLDDLQLLAEAMVEQGCAFSYFDQSRLWVYNTWAFIEKMEREHGSGLFNSGAWAIRKNALSIDDIWKHARHALALKAEMYPGFDQSVPNFCVDRAGLRPRSVASLLPEFGESHRPLHQRELITDNSSTFMRDKGSLARGKRVMLLHWAGSGLHPFMPMRSAFLRYRLAGARSLCRLKYHAGTWAHLPAERVQAWRKRHTYPSVSRPTPV